MRRLALLLLIPGLLALSYEPATWLVKTWVHAGYDSVGAWVFALCVALTLRSVLSGPADQDNTSSSRATWLLLGAAGIRLAGCLLEVNHIGAVALALDAGALGLALRLHARPWPVNPGRLAALFALSLPIKQLLQHFFGFSARAWRPPSSRTSRWTGGALPSTTRPHARCQISSSGTRCA